MAARPPGAVERPAMHRAGGDYDRRAVSQPRVMARHGFGRGEYKYFAYPLPEPVAVLAGCALSAAGGDRQPLERGNGDRSALSARARRLSRALPRSGQTKPTPPLLQYGAGDYNCLHQDLYGEHVFPLQVTLLLSRPGEDFTGGEFVLTEQRTAHAVAGGDRAARARRGRDLSGASPAGAGHPRHLSGQHAPRREPLALRPSSSPSFTTPSRPERRIDPFRRIAPARARRYEACMTTLVTTASETPAGGGAQRDCPRLRRGTPRSERG